MKATTHPEFPHAELVGYFGVDSGQVMIGDPCYLDAWRMEMEEEGGEFNASLPKPYPYTYNGACSATCSKESAGVLGQISEHRPEGTAIVTNTGYGDGSYPVFVEREGNRIMRIIIDFGQLDMDEDEDTCEMCDEHISDCECE